MHFPDPALGKTAPYRRPPRGRVGARRLGQPQVGIEATGLVGRVLGAVALGAVAGPVAALLPLIEQGSTNAVDPCTVAAAPAQAAAKPEAPVRQKP